MCGRFSRLESYRHTIIDMGLPLKGLCLTNFDLVVSVKIVANVKSSFLGLFETFLISFCLNIEKKNCFKGK